jgi:hypothetical protein
LLCSLIWMQQICASQAVFGMTWPTMKCCGWGNIKHPKLFSFPLCISVKLLYRLCKNWGYHQSPKKIQSYRKLYLTLDEGCLTFCADAEKVFYFFFLISNFPFIYTHHTFTFFWCVPIYLNIYPNCIPYFSTFREWSTFSIMD